jgi:hypothetical protein
MVAGERALVQATEERTLVMTTLIATLYVVLGLPKRNGELLAFAKAVQTALTGNPHFPNPTPTLAVLAADIAAFDLAETAAASKTKGAATNRNGKKAKVVQDLRHLRDYVQGVAENVTTDPLTVVESAGLKVKKARTQHKQALVVKDTTTSGTVSLVAKAVALVATYYWQYSLDGKTWTSCPDTMKASIIVAGLTAGQTYSFRFRTLTRAGASDFTQVVTHLVR